jgi:hypothetical protein
MKRLLLMFAIAGLCGTAGLYLASCASQKGPLSPNTTLLGGSSGSSAKLPTASLLATGTPAKVSRTVQVQFTAAMDPSSLNSSTVQLWNPTTDGLNETSYGFFSLSYDAANRILNISPDPNHNSGFWDDNTYYEIVITTGVRSLSGKPLDSNGNGIAESGEFDNFHASFYTGAPVFTPPALLTAVYNTAPITGGISATDSNHATTSFGTSGGYAGNFAVAAPVTITASFGLMDVDQSTI